MCEVLDGLEMIVDIIGPNAVGKTTLVNSGRLGPDIVHGKEVIKAAKKAERFGADHLVDRFFEKHPDAIKVYTEKFSHRHKARPWVQKKDSQAIRHEILLRSLESDKYYLPQRGILKLLVELWVHSDLKDYALVQLLISWPPPHMIVIVWTDMETGWRRFVARNDKAHTRNSYVETWKRFSFLRDKLKSVYRNKNVKLKEIIT